MHTLLEHRQNNVLEEMYYLHPFLFLLSWCHPEFEEVNVNLCDWLHSETHMNLWTWDGLSSLELHCHNVTLLYHFFRKYAGVFFQTKGTTCHNEKRRMLIISSVMLFMLLLLLLLLSMMKTSKQVYIRIWVSFQTNRISAVTAEHNFLHHNIRTLF